ncbi:MAG: zf-HC2 domain-containing protein [Bdellovibrionales bacterium]|nr:zf-HC2 domain-containing protein [Bdellovibrionales bacterium]
MDNEKSSDTVRSATMLMLSCNEAELLLDEYLDDELSELDRRRFERHLETCDECAALVRDCRHIVETAKLLVDRPVPPAVSQRLRARLQEELGVTVAAPKPSLSLVE